jgi:hypothetical protein
MFVPFKCCSCFHIKHVPLQKNNWLIFFDRLLVRIFDYCFVFASTLLFCVRWYIFVFVFVFVFCLFLLLFLFFVFIFVFVFFFVFSNLLWFHIKFLYSFESEILQKLVKDKKIHEARSLISV